MEALRKRFGKYHVLDKIAQGGMAEVYKVKTIGIAGFEKVQALKRILPRQAREGRFIRSFIDEARIAVELTHRNIVQVFDFGKADGELFLAMELIEGKDLRTTMTDAAARDFLPSVPIAAYIVSEVASGLDYAHKKTDGHGGSLGIVHCDVSPSNVMLSTEGDIKILDFGIARATFSSALERRRLRGKPRYMAPEQTIGEVPSPASDVFALGIIAWELMTGKPLYRGGELKAILEAVRNIDPPRVDELNPTVPVEIADAIALALARDPAQRGSAADLANACARMAMHAGPRALARWLADLAARPSRAVVPWQPEVTSLSVPPPDPGRPGATEELSDPLGDDEPAATRPMARQPLHEAADRDSPWPPARSSGTTSIGGAVPARSSGTTSVGDALPPARPSVTISLGDPLPPARPSVTVSLGDLVPAPRAEDVPPPARATMPLGGRFDVDRSTTEQRPELTSTEPVAARHDLAAPRPPAAPGRQALDRGGWQPEPTMMGHARLADAYLPEPATEPARRSQASLASPASPASGEAAASDSRPSLRRSYERLEIAPGVAPPNWFDDDATNHSFALPRGVLDSASFEELDAAIEALGAGESTTGARAGGRSEHRSAGRSEDQSEDRSEDRSDEQVAGRSDERSAGRSDERSAGRSVGRSDEQVAGPAGAPAGPVAADPSDDRAADRTANPAEDSAEEPAEDPIDDDLGAMPAGALAEHRRVVVVAGQLSGAPPDALRSVTKSLGELAYQRGGVVIEHRPEALLVAFGLEVAGEDDVAVAMGWALDAAAMARDTVAEGEAVQVRIGARAGVTTAISARAESPGAAHPSPSVPRIPQDAIDEARALARDAAPDRPLFVGGAGRITSSLYALRELPAARRIGRRSRVIEVVGPRGFEERDRARLERRGKFVGRTAQLAELEVWFHRALVADRRLCVLLTGAAGTGKSRLVAELIARRIASGTPTQITTTAASPASRLAPFATVIDLYQAALGLPPSRGRGARAQVVHRLYHRMVQAGTPPDRARAVTLDLDRAMELRDGLGVAGREAADLRPRISAGLAAFRVAMARRERPALTVVEDIHLADSASLEVLRHALAMPAHGPELLVLTMRPEGTAPPATDFVLTLGDLAGTELRTLIIDRLGDAATPKAIAAVLERGGGNPLFIEELAQAVRDAGGEDVPASARDVVSARIDRLLPRAKLALQLAAVIGGTVRARLLEEMLGEDSLDDELDELIAAGFLVHPDGAGEGEVAFARGLVREVVYDSLSARTQRETHARIGRLLASRYLAGREEPPAAIAEHLERGGELAGAAAFWLRAGRLAMSASDAGAAVACFGRTLGLERELGATPPTPPSRARRREALAGREEAHRLQGDLVSDPGDLAELERLCEGEPARLASVAIRRAQRLLRVGDYAAAGDATVVAEGHAAAGGDDRLRGEALRVRGEILERIGRFDEALAVVGAARELFHRQRAVADEMAAMVGRGRIHLLRAHYEAARDAYRPVLALIDQTGDPWLERIVKNHVAVIEMCLGNFTAAMQCAERSLELCRRYGDRGREGDALSVAGIVLLEVGLHDRAAAMFGEALDLLSRTNSRWSRADCLIYAGTCEQRRGRPDGLRMLDEAIVEARRLGARYLEANALVARAAAHLRAGALDAAIADASAGAEVAREVTLVGYEIQGLARHALALSRLGNRSAEAGALVHRALTLLDAQKYLEGSEEEVLVACATVLDAAGGAERARALRERGRTSARRKLDALTDPAWRAAYAALPEIAELLR